MNQIKTAQDIKQLGTILGIWAHPDDEVMSMCGIMCAAIQNGQTVVCVTATRGEAGIQDESRWPGRRLGAIREAELKTAYKLVGLQHHYFLDYPDGHCAEVDDSQAVQRLVSLIETYQPDSIMTFGSDGMTGHPDHQAISRWAGLACEKTGNKAKLYHSILTRDQLEAIRPIDERFNFFFNVDKPKTCDDQDCVVRFELDDDLFECKLSCLRAMPSQYEAVMLEFGDSLRPSLGAEAFIDAA